jgi:glycopeptide antibiotics resistance protein
MKYDTGYIKDYIQNYDIGVPFVVVIVTCLFVCGIVLLLFRVKTNNSVFVRQASFCMLMGYVFLVLCTTIFYREETFEKRYYLQPLWSYGVLYNKLLAQIIMNVMLFFPIGFFVGGALKKKHIWNALRIGFALSFFIELTQLITTRGVFNVDDIIHNTLGCVIGFLCFVACYKMLKNGFANE